MILNNQLVNDQITSVQKVACFLWERGWAERNAGNISINLTELFLDGEITQMESEYLEASLPLESANMVLFFTVKGKRFRDLIAAPERNSCILQIDSQAKGYRVIWGGKPSEGFIPTSEFISHLDIHLFNQNQVNEHRCVVHTHPTELIALSHHPVFGSNEILLNRALWGMLPEVKMFVPRGIGLVPYLLPGSAQLADATVIKLKAHDLVLWRKHGVLATGEDAFEAFDFLDVANKGASIYLKCLQAGFTPVGLSEEEVKGLDVFL